MRSPLRCGLVALCLLMPAVGCDQKASEATGSLIDLRIDPAIEAGMAADAFERWRLIPSEFENTLIQDSSDGQVR